MWSSRLSRLCRSARSASTVGARSCVGSSALALLLAVDLATSILSRSLMCLLSGRDAGHRSTLIGARSCVGSSACFDSCRRRTSPRRYYALAYVLPFRPWLWTSSLRLDRCALLLLRLVLRLDSCRRPRHHVDTRSLCASFPNNSGFLLAGRIRSSFRERHLNVVNK